MKELLTARIIIMCLLLLMASKAHADVLTFHTSDSQINPGYDNQGRYYNCCHSPGAFRDGFATGRMDNIYFRSYLTFDLSTLTGNVTSATLTLPSLGVYRGLSAVPEPTETIGFYDVSTDAFTLNTTTVLSPSIYDDLGSGNSYGTYTFNTESPPENITIPLNSQALYVINHLGGNFFSIGAALLTFPEIGSEYVFSEEGPHSLVLEVSGPTPESTLITEVADSLGNVQTNSWADDGNGNWPDGVATPITLDVGDVVVDPVTFTAQAYGTNLEYQFAVQPTGWSFNAIPGCEWSSVNTCTWDLQESDYGARVVVQVSVRDGDGQDEMGEESLGDDYTYLSYSVDAPQASTPAVLDQACDDLSPQNCTEWSWGDDGTAGWSDGRDNPGVHVGDLITFTAQATDPFDPEHPEETILEYAFAVGPNGNFPSEVSWSASNTWTWEVRESDAGSFTVVLINTTDNDGYEWMGKDYGDDYLYMVYEVTHPDDDNDGVNNNLDKCPDTNYGPFPLVVDKNGCSIRDLVPCDSEEWSNHGQFMKNLTKISKKFVHDGLITDKERGNVISEGAISHCGH